MRGECRLIVIILIVCFINFHSLREICCSDRDLVNILPLLKKLSPSNIFVNSSTKVTIAITILSFAPAITKRQNSNFSNTHNFSS